MVFYDPIGTKHASSVMSMPEAFRVAEMERANATFLLCIGVLVLASLRHGMLSILCKSDNLVLRTPSHLALNLLLLALGLVLLWQGFTMGRTLSFVFAGISIFGSLGNLRFCFKKELVRNDWLVSHLSAMIGAGIGTHTAFFVFGAQQFMADYLQGNMQLIPWVAPAIIGTYFTYRLTKKYQPKMPTIKSKPAVA